MPAAGKQSEHTGFYSAICPKPVNIRLPLRPLPAHSHACPMSGPLGRRAAPPERCQPAGLVRRLKRRLLYGTPLPAEEMAFLLKKPPDAVFTASGGFTVLLLQFCNGDAIFPLAVTAEAERGHIPMRTQTVGNGSAEHTSSLAMNDTDRF